MATLAPPRTSGDEREDAASAAGAAAGDVLERAELVILAAMAAELRKISGGSLTAQNAQRHIRALVAATFGDAMRRIRLLLDRLPPATQWAIRLAVLQAQASAVTAFRQASEAMAGTLSELFREAIAAAFTGRPDPLALPVRDTATLRQSQIAAAQQVMDSLAARGITGFTGSDGRQWDVAAYVRVSVRGATSKAHLDRQVQAFASAGQDLVLVVGPSGDATCKNCRPWADRIVSLGPVPQESASITDAGGVTRTRQIAGTLEQAIAEGLFHLSCRHGLSPWEDGAEVPVRGTGPGPDYAAQQELRRHARDLRMARRRAAAALTPMARRQARARLGMLT